LKKGEKQVQQVDAEGVCDYKFGQPIDSNTQSAKLTNIPSLRNENPDKE